MMFNLLSKRQNLYCILMGLHVRFESMKKYYLENQDRFKGVANERIHEENKA